MNAHENNYKKDLGHVNVSTQNGTIYIQETPDVKKNIQETPVNWVFNISNKNNNVKKFIKF